MWTCKRTGAVFDNEHDYLDHRGTIVHDRYMRMWGSHMLKTHEGTVASIKRCTSLTDIYQYVEKNASAIALTAAMKQGTDIPWYTINEFKISIIAHPFIRWTNGGLLSDEPGWINQVDVRFTDAERRRDVLPSVQAMFELLDIRVLKAAVGIYQHQYRLLIPAIDWPEMLLYRRLNELD